MPRNGDTQTHNDTWFLIVRLDLHCHHQSIAKLRKLPTSRTLPSVQLRERPPTAEGLLFGDHTRLNEPATRSKPPPNAFP